MKLILTSILAAWLSASCFASPLAKRVAAVKIGGASANYGPDPYVAPACLTACSDYWQNFRWPGASEPSVSGALYWKCNSQGTAYAASLTACASCMSTNPADGQTALDETVDEYDSECNSYAASSTGVTIATATLTGAAAESPTGAALPKGVYAGENLYSWEVWVAPTCLSTCGTWVSTDRACLSTTFSITDQAMIEQCECSSPTFAAQLSACASCVEQNPADSVIHYNFRNRVLQVGFDCKDFVTADAGTTHALQNATIFTSGGYTPGPTSIDSSSSSTGSTSRSATSSPTKPGTASGRRELCVGEGVFGASLVLVQVLMHM